MTDEDKKLSVILAIELEEALLESIEATAKEVKKKYGINVDEAKMKEEAHIWAVNRANESAVSINTTTKEFEATLEGMTEAQISEAVSMRAEEISITETTSALSTGNVMVWTMAGIENVSWVTENDDAVCEICQGNEDGEAFSSGDTEPPAHPSCRCFLIEH